MPYTLSQRLTLAIVPPLAALLIRVLGATLRYEDVFEPATQPRIPGDQIPGPTIYAFWHRSLLVCAHRFRRRNIAILISRSFDGELIARTVERLGFRAIRGSSSRGGPTARRRAARAACGRTLAGRLLCVPPPRLDTLYLGPLPDPQTFLARRPLLARAHLYRPSSRARTPGRPSIHPRPHRSTNH